MLAWRPFRIPGPDETISRSCRPDPGRAGRRRACGGNGIGRLANVCGRGKRSAAIDLKDEEGRELLLRLAATADVLIEGLRPGVAERLGIGPEQVAAVNPRLVYGRMTGWGQDGPMAPMAGHDINYIGLIGALHAIGDESPVPPLKLLRLA